MITKYSTSNLLSGKVAQIVFLTVSATLSTGMSAQSDFETIRAWKKGIYLGEKLYDHQPNLNEGDLNEGVEYCGMEMRGIIPPYVDRLSSGKVSRISPAKAELVELGLDLREGSVRLAIIPGDETVDTLIQDKPNSQQIVLEGSARSGISIVRVWRLTFSQIEETEEVAVDKTPPPSGIVGISNLPVSQIITYEVTRRIDQKTNEKYKCVVKWFIHTEGTASSNTSFEDPVKILNKK